MGQKVLKAKKADLEDFSIINSNLVVACAWQDLIEILVRENNVSYSQVLVKVSEYVNDFENFLKEIKKNEKKSSKWK